MVTYQNAVALALLALLEAAGACVVCGGVVGDDVQGALASVGDEALRCRVDSDARHP